MSMGKLRPARKRGNSLPVRRGKTSKRKSTPEEKRAQNLKVLNPQYSGDRDVERLIAIFEQKEGERHRFPDPHKMHAHLRRSKRKMLNVVDSMFKLGFTLDEHFYYIDGNGITSPSWARDAASLYKKAQELPRVQFAISNLSADVWQMYELTKVDYEVWLGEQWAKSDKPGTGLFGAVVKRVEAYIHRQTQYIDFMSEMAELKMIYAKLKGLLESIKQQQFFINTMLNSLRRTPDMSNIVGNTHHMESAPSTSIDSLINEIKLDAKDDDGDIQDYIFNKDGETLTLSESKGKKKRRRKKK